MFEVLLHFASLMLCLKLVREMLGILKMWDLQHYNLKLLPESPWPQAPAVPLRKRSMSSFKDLQRSRHSGLLGTSGLGRSLRFSLLFHLDLFKFHDFSSNPRFSQDVLIPPTSLGSLPRLFGSAGIWASGPMILSKACDFGPIDLSCSRHKHGTFFHFRFSALPPEFHRPEMLHWKWQHFHPDQLCSTGASRTDGIVMSFTKRFTACFNTPSLEVCSFIEPFLSLYGTDCVTECLIMIVDIRYL